MLGQALKTVNTLIVSGGQGSSDNQTVAAISDALMTVSSSNGAAPAAGVNMSEWAATGWEQLLEGFLDWLSMESAAMKCDNPIAPSIKKLVEGAEVNQPLDLGETVIKHLAFNKISEAWDATCSCGEHRTETNAATCPVHQQDHTDLLDVVFQIAQLVCSELRPSLVSLALKLRKFHADHKGGHPDCIMNHEKGDVLKELLKPGNVLRLTSFRSEYMIQQFARILGHRSEFKKIDLVTKIKAHRTSFYQVDMTCGMVEADVFASVYGAALSSLVKNGSFRIDDVTDSMPTKAAEAATATATSKTSNGSSSVEGTTLDESGVSVNSQQRLSEFGIRMDYDNENDVSTQL
ncbi:Uncharacterized protein SCF082_LOCUS20507, partial [Durusdinium trenchii]